MKKMFFIAMLGLSIASCTSNWEYKVVTVKGADKEASKFDPNKFDVTGENLNLFGKDGWELVGVTCVQNVFDNLKNRRFEAS